MIEERAVQYMDRAETLKKSIDAAKSGGGAGAAGALTQA
jgi:hypothetical protein